MVAAAWQFEDDLRKVITSNNIWRCHWTKVSDQERAPTPGLKQ
jgi:hypothetical protein